MELGEMIDLRQVMVQTFMEAAQEGVNLAVVVSDSTSTAKIAAFREVFPERVINVGIAEQNLVGVAAGLSLGGYVAVTANAAPFLISRANEQVKNDVCYSQTNVKLIGLNAGVCYGALASTHHAIDDISVMRGLGHIQILAPSDPVETAQMVRYALDIQGPVYLRLDCDKFPVLHDPAAWRFVPGQPDVLKTGRDITLLAVGSTVKEAWQAATQLAAEGIDAEVINVSSFRPLSCETIVASLQKTGRAVTVEEHSLHGGLGSLIAGIIAEFGLQVRFKSLGITEGTFSKAGPRGDIRAYYQIDASGIAGAVNQLLK